MTIAAILSDKGADVVKVPPDANVADVVALLYQHRIGAVLVVDGETVAGVVSERDIVRGLHRLGAAVLDKPVTACMSDDVVTIAPTDTIGDALAVMTERRFRHLPVVEHGRLRGLVSIGDLVKRRIDDATREAALLHDYISAA